MAQSECDWNLVLDADEYLVKGIRKDLEAFMENMEHVGAIQADTRKYIAYLPFIEQAYIILKN